MPGLLATKLYRPPIPALRVERPHLIRRLNEGLSFGRRITLVSAPAGFGKTTCVCEWIDGLDLPVAWLSLDASDDDPGRFFTYLAAALQHVTANQDAGEGILPSGQLPSAEAVSAALVNHLLALEAQSILVLDDFHVLQDRFILQVLERLIDNLPPSIHLVLVTREDPSLPLARLRANNQMTEIRARDLRFSGYEAERFLNEVMSLALSQSDVSILEGRTEGWIVGLQLAGFSIRDRANPSDFIAGLSGTHRHILSYLTEEVLSRQPEDIQQFLLKTAILDKLNGDLCNAVTGRADGHDLLERLLSANLFLISLDDDQRWYRYHHLFADLLTNRLRQTLADDAVQQLHRLAGEWLAANDLPDEAIQHTLAGEDYDRAASLVEQAARDMMFSGRVSTLRRWLALLPEETFLTHHRLTIYRVWIDLMHGTCDAETALEVERTLNALPASPENDLLRAEFMVVLCRFVAMTGDTSKAIRLAEEALRHLPEDDLAARARAQSALTLAYGAEGDGVKGRQAYHECIRLSLASRNYSLASHTTLVVADAQPHHGLLREAAGLCQSIIDLGDQAGQKVFYPAGHAYIGLAGIHLEWNDLDTAEDYVTRGIDLCRQGGLAGELTGRIIMSRLRQARGDLEGALEEIATLEQPIQSIADVSIPVRHIRLRLAMGDLEGASRWASELSAKLDAHPDSVHLPLLMLEAIQSALIRFSLAKNDAAQALRLLDALESTAGPGGRTGRLIEVHLLRALARQLEQPEAISPDTLEMFKRALDLAEPEGFALLFVEEGPAVIPLLDAVVADASAPERLRQYAQTLLGAFPDGAGSAASLSGSSDELIEQLTPREMEVLQRIAAGDSNQMIADRLVITLSAVKKHTGNIFGKLDVGSRTQAIVRARQLGLLQADQ